MEPLSASLLIDLVSWAGRRSPTWSMSWLNIPTITEINTLRSHRSALAAGANPACGAADQTALELARLYRRT